MLSLLYQDLEAFSFQLYSVNADMEEHRKICICLESDGMLCVKNKLYLAVFRSADHRVLRCDYSTLSHHSFRKAFIRRCGKVCSDTGYRAVDNRCSENLFLRLRAGFGCRSCVLSSLTCTFCCTLCIRLSLIFRIVCFFLICTFKIFIRRCLQIILQLGFDHSYLRTVDDLHALAFFHDSSGACCFQNVVVNSCCIMDGDTESCCTAVHIADVFLSSKAGCDGFTYRVCRCTSCCFTGFSGFFSRVYICFCIKLCFCVVILTSRSLEVELFDQEGEDHIIENKVNDTYRDNPEPACLCISLKDPEQEQIKETAGKGKSYCNVQHMCDHISRACKNNLYRKQCRSYKQERELQWLCDSCKHTCKGCGKKKSACCFFLLRLCTAVHGKSCSRKTEDHENELSGKISCCICAEMSYICRICKLGEEDVLSALYHLACNLHSPANSCLPEWHIKYVMKSEGDQRTFDNTEDQSSDIAAACYKTTQSINTVLDCRPYEIHQDSHKHIYNGGNDGHKSGTTEEGKCVWKHDLMKTVVQSCNTKADDDTAKHTHL